MIVLAKGHKAEEETLSWKLVHFFLSLVQRKLPLLNDASSSNLSSIFSLLSLNVGRFNSHQNNLSSVITGA